MPVYRCMGCLVLIMWCWGVSLYVWSTARINYLYMFELSPTRTMTYDRALHKAGVLSAAFCANFLLFFKTVRSEIPLLGGTSPGAVQCAQRFSATTPRAAPLRPSRALQGGFHWSWCSSSWPSSCTRGAAR